MTDENQQKFNDLLKQAESGDAIAMVLLAIAYYKGEGVNRNEEEFFWWIKKAAQSGQIDVPNLSANFRDSIGEDQNLLNFFLVTEMDNKVGPTAAWIIIGSINALLKSGKLDTATGRKIMTTLSELMSESHKILRKKHGVESGKFLSHYTDFTALDSILKGSALKSNHLRLYNVAYFNDPNEGATFPAALEKEMRSLIYGSDSEIPHEITIIDNKVFSVYACSFSEEADRLDLWRAYGKNGEGYSITVRIPDNMKADDASNILQQMHVPNLSALSADKNTPISKPPDEGDIRIYKVLYGNDAVNDAVDAVKPSLLDLQEAMQNKERIVAEIVWTLAQWILADLRYLYKHEAYKPEQEYRIIGVAEFRDDELDSDKCDEKIRTPQRLFIKTPPCLFLETGCTITIGPRVPNKAVAELDIRRRLARNKWDTTTKIFRSEMPYR